MIISLLSPLRRGGSRVTRAAAVLLPAGHLVLLLSALTARVDAFALGAAVVWLAEAVLQRSGGRYPALFRRARLGLGVRMLLRHLLLLLLLVRAGCPTALVVAADTALVCLPVLVFVHDSLARVLRTRTVPPVHSRNAPVGPTGPVTGPARACRWMNRCDLPAQAGLIAAAGTGWEPAGYAGLAASAVWACGALTAMGRRAARCEPVRRAEVLQRTNRWLAEAAPAVVLYFSGSGRSVYQVDMWLRAVERLDVPAVVLLRERAVLERLAPTALPVLCVPAAVDVMDLDLSSVRVGLYVANVGKNIHLLREPGIRHVFLGHGDSDKSASANPFVKAYDEVWVAGPAGRQRYRDAEVGVADAAVVEIGRPQVAGIRRDPPGDPRRGTTVLYAPTWEGWTDAPGASSLVPAGEAVVRGLLAMEPPVRVLYRPHPLTGHRSRAARAAHERIAALLRSAAGADGSAGHRVLCGPGAPGLHESFDEVHALVSDVSSVVSDFLASGKPYAVVDTTGRSPSEFRAQHPTARAGYVVGPDGSGLEDLVAAVRGPGADPLAGARRELRAHLLGADGPDPQERFAEAVRRLAAAAERRNRRRAPAG